MKVPINANYAAIITKVDNIVQLENCSNIQAAIILGNQVLVDKSVNIGDIGVYFPVECQLSKEYLSKNNLYRNKDLNTDKTKSGYFEENGRVRCVKLRKNDSEGLFMPLESLSSFTDISKLALKDCFDELNGIEICRKYVVKTRISNGMSIGNQKHKVSKLINNQFKFHDDTEMLFKHLDEINPDSIVHISYKIHGTSAISANILCKRKLNLIEKIFNYLGLSIQLEEYSNIYSSRRVIQNDDVNNNFYQSNVWGEANKYIKSFLKDSMTFYYEIAGYLPNGSMIQKEFDYGCESLKSSKDYQEGINYKIFIYRITYTNDIGEVFEFTGPQVQQFCKKYGLRPVPELYYGYAKDLIPNTSTSNIEEWRQAFLKALKDKYNEKDCFICKNKVPEEGCVIRVENSLNFKAYKQKSVRFLQKETKDLDKGINNIEEEN